MVNGTHVIPNFQFALVNLTLIIIPYFPGATRFPYYIYIYINNFNNVCFLRFRNLILNTHFLVKTAQKTAPRGAVHNYSPCKEAPPGIYQWSGSSLMPMASVYFPWKLHMLEWNDLKVSLYTQLFSDTKEKNKFGNRAEHTG